MVLLIPYLNLVILSIIFLGEDIWAIAMDDRQRLVVVKQ